MTSNSSTTAHDASHGTTLWEDITSLYAITSWKSSLLLAGDLVFLYVLCLCGLVVTLSALGGLIRPDGTTPRNRWLYIICGVVSVISGCFSGPPLLLSPESTAGVKAGARTGLSSIVCGLLFALSVFFGPTLKAIPYAATSPVLIIVGIILFQNVSRLDWRVTKDAVPSFFVAFFVPFTYSVMQGVGVGYGMYIAVALCTGDLYTDALALWKHYFSDYHLVHHDSSASEMSPLQGGVDVHDGDMKDGHAYTSSSSLLHSPHEEWALYADIDGCESAPVPTPPSPPLPPSSSPRVPPLAALDIVYNGEALDDDRLVVTPDPTDSHYTQESKSSPHDVARPTPIIHISNSTGTMSELTPLSQQRQAQLQQDQFKSPGLKHRPYSFAGRRSSAGSRRTKSTSNMSNRLSWSSRTDMDGLDWSVPCVQTGFLLNEKDEEAISGHHELHNPMIRRYTAYRK